MAKAKRLPSGSYRCQVYDYTDKNGKRIYKSFTAPTKKEAELMATQYSIDKEAAPESARDMTLAEAMDEYIAMKCNVLSPTTIRCYAALRAHAYNNLLNRKLVKITSLDVQRWANLYAIDHSPKTVRNAHGFLSAVIYAYLPNTVLRTTLPDKVRSDLHTPNDREVLELLNYHEENNDKDMLIASYLAAFGTLRRSEICALTADDVEGDMIHVRRAYVYTNDGFVIKPFPKNLSSARDVEFPQFVIDLFPESGNLVNINPNQITDRHRRAVLALGLPEFRFHDLRHYAASIMHALGIPDQYIMLKGGWKTDSTLKKIYRGAIDDYILKFQNVALSHFENMRDMQHKMHHDLKKVP